MNVEIRLYATLRRCRPDAPGGVFIHQTADGTLVSQVLTELGVDLAEVHIIMINGVGSAMTDVLKDNDRLGVFPPIGGG